MHKSTAGSQGRADFRELGRQYREHHVSQDPEMHRLGEFARDTALVGGQLRYGVSSFGPTTRHVHRAFQRRALESAWGRLKDLNPAERVEALVKTGSLDATDTGKILKMASTYRRMETKAKKQAVLDDINVLKKFETSVGQAQLARLQSIMPVMTSQADFLTTVPWPSQCGVCFHWTPHAAEAVTKSVAYASRSRQTNLAGNLEKEWQELHLPVCHTDVEPPTLRTTKPTLCQKAGLCLCEGEGKLLKRFKFLVFQSMRQVFADKPQREHLASGNVVVMFSSTGEQADPDDSIILQELWFHVGFVSFSPYTACFQVLQRVDTPLYDALGDGVQDRLYMKARPPSLGTQVARMYKLFWLSAG